MPAIVLTYPREDIERELEVLTSGGRSIALIGPPGTGKSQLAKRLAAQLGVPAYVFASGADRQDTDMTLSFLPAGKNGTWGPVPGPYANAAGHGPRFGFPTKPGILVIDDVHRAGGGMEDAMMVACDGRFTEWMDPTTGDMLTPHDDYRCILTSNAPDAESLDPAVRDRVAFIIPVLVPSEAMLAVLHPDVRSLCEADYDHNPKPAVSFRQWQSLSFIWDKLGIAKACLAVMGSDAQAKKMLVALASDTVESGPEGEMTLAAIAAVRELTSAGDHEVADMMRRAAA